MIEPFSAFWSGQFLAGVIGNVLASRIDARGMAALERTRRESRQRARPYNHHLQRAIWWAFLASGVIECDWCLERMGVPWRGLGQLKRLPARLDERKRTLLVLEKRLERRLDFPLISDTTESEVAPGRGGIVAAALEDVLPLADVVATPPDALAEIDERATEWFLRLARELSKPDELPSELELLVREGLPAKRPVDERPRWFQLARELFLDRLTTDESAWVALQVSVLAVEHGQRGSAPSIDVLEQELKARKAELEATFEERFTELNGWLGQQLAEADATLKTAVTDLKEHLDDRLASLRPLLTSLDTDELKGMIDDLRSFSRSARSAQKFGQHFGRDASVATEQRLDEVMRSPLVGRDQSLDQLDRFLGERKAGSLVVAGPSGSGKTVLLARWVREHHLKDAFIAYHFVNPDAREATITATGCWDNLLRQVLAYHGEQPGELAARVRSRADLMALLSRQAHADEPLVIVVDGLDEIEWPDPARRPESPFYLPLPTGVFVIASTRLEERDFLDPKAWEHDEIVRLTSDLDWGAIREWLTQAGDGELAQYANEPQLLEQLAEKSGGLPIYLNYKIDDMLCAARAGEDVSAVVADAPSGLVGLIEKEFLDLARDESDESILRLFDYLAAARGPLANNDLQELFGISERRVRGLKWRFRRWLRTLADNANGHSVSFQHPAIAAAYAASPAFKDEVADARRELRKYCENWREHGGTYAPRYLLDYLHEQVVRADDNPADARWAIVNLAEDEEFLNRQTDALCDEPALPLRLLVAGFVAALELGEISVAIRLLDKNAKRWQALSETNPLDALRRDRAGEAIELASLRNEPSKTLWLLLVAGELEARGDDEGVERALERLSSTEKVVPWPDTELLVAVLAWVGGVLADPRLVMAARPSGQYPSFSDGLVELARVAAATGRFDAALESARAIDRGAERVRALAGVARAQAAAGADASSSLAAAITTASAIDSVDERVAALAEIARTQTSTGIAASSTLDAAIANARSISDARSRVKALADLAQTQVMAAADPNATIKEAVKAARSVEDAASRVSALVDIARAQAATEADASKTIDTAILAARSIDNINKRRWAMLDVVRAQAAAGQFAEARASADSFGADTHDLALIEIVRAQAAAERVKAALEYCRSIKNAGMFVQALTAVARAQATAGEDATGTLEEACATASSIGNAFGRVVALAEVATAQVVAGADARPTLETALQTPRDHDLSSERVSALVELARAQLRVKTDASTALEAASSTAHSIDDLDERGWAMAELALAQAEAGHFEAAVARAALIDDPDDRIEALAEVIRAQSAVGTCTGLSLDAVFGDVREELDENDAARLLCVVQAVTGQFEAARETALSIDDPWSRPWALTDVTRAQAALGQYEAAICTAESIEDAAIQVSALADIARAQVAAGRDPASPLAAANSLARSIDAPLLRLWTLGVVAQAQAIARVDAAPTLEAALVSARLVEEARQDVQEPVLYPPLMTGVQFHAALATVQAAASQFEAALTTARSINDVSNREEAVAEVARAQAAAAMFDEAIETTGMITDNFVRAHTLREVTQAQAITGTSPISSLRQIASTSVTNDTWIALAIAYPQHAQEVVEVL